ncbi:MAG: hypothetical protein RLZZ08_1568 [Pseudomonadota bacterium]|jgi:hypothetical protein
MLRVYKAAESENPTAMSVNAKPHFPLRFFTVAVSGLAAVLALAVGAPAVPAIAAGPEMTMLDTIAKGGWNLRIRDDGRDQKICLKDGRELIQLQHKQPGCSRFVVTDAADQVVVQYTCRGDGYGRTSIRKESKTLLQVQTQGIQDGKPFSYSAEARFTGAC